MGKDLAEADPGIAKLFDQADEILGRDLKRIIFEGPEEALKETSNTQPALFVVNVAAASMIRSGAWAEEPDFLAGHSLGEYCALHEAGVFSFEDGLKLVDARAKAMAEAAREQPGSMAAILGLEDSLIDAACERASVHPLTVQAANYNSPGQVVISGHSAAVEKAAEYCREAGAAKCIMLPVSGAFHSSLMKGAGSRLENAFSKVAWNPARKPVVSNINGLPYGDLDSIRKGLVAQVSGPVRWTSCMRTLLDKGADRFVEVGPGRVLQGLMKKIEKSAACFGAGDLASIKKGPPWLTQAS